MKRFMSLLLCLTILSGVSVTGDAADTDKAEDVPFTAVYAASDFQAHGFVGDNIESGKQIMQTIIREMIADGYLIESACYLCSGES